MRLVRGNWVAMGLVVLSLLQGCGDNEGERPATPTAKWAFDDRGDGSSLILNDKSERAELSLECKSSGEVAWFSYSKESEIRPEMANAEAMPYDLLKSQGFMPMIEVGGREVHFDSARVLGYVTRYTVIFSNVRLTDFDGAVTASDEYSIISIKQPASHAPTDVRSNISNLKEIWPKFLSKCKL